MSVPKWRLRVKGGWNYRDIGTKACLSRSSSSKLAAFTRFIYELQKKPRATTGLHAGKDSP